jgi:hypothetical protein
LKLLWWRREERMQLYRIFFFGYNCGYNYFHIIDW